MNGLSLCSGIAGIDLGLKLAVSTYRTICYVEIEPFCQEVLLARMADGVLDSAPIWGDIEQFDARPWQGLVDVVHAGYPCQPFSTAARGRRRAVNLWPEVGRVIGECGPRYVFLENVVGAFRYTVEVVRPELERLGYCAHPPAIVAAASVGAPHIRRRLWLFAHANGRQELSCSVDAKAPLVSSDEGPWADYSEALGVADEVPHRVDRLKALGNGVVPEVAAFAWQTLYDELTR